MGSTSAAFPCHLGPKCAPRPNGREAGAFGDPRCEREDLCGQQTQPERLSRFGVNPDGKAPSGRVRLYLLPHSPLGERHKWQLFPRNLPAGLPPSAGVLAGAGLRTGRLQETQEQGSKPASVKLMINLGCWGRVTQSTPVALGTGRELRPRPRAEDGKCDLQRLPRCLSGLGSAPGAKVGSSSPPDKLLVN